MRALKNEDLQIAYQPIVALADGSVFAHEALVRCTVPEFRAPPVLFAAAEAEEYCGNLGRKIREVCFSQVLQVPLFVNLHPNELAEGWLVRPDDPIGFHGPGVYLEVTETAAFARPEVTKLVLREMRERIGAKIVVDDFGAGHSDVFRVLELEPDFVKLDRTLISGADRSSQMQARLTYLIDLCTELGAQVVVEGIETPEELRVARAAGAPYGQGYLFARPGQPPPVPVWNEAWLRGIAGPSRRPSRRR